MHSSHNPDLARFLKRLTSRSVLSQEEQRAILSLPGRVEHVQSNRDFVRLGEQTDHSCLVSEGWVGRFGQNASGERQVTAIHVPGDMPDLASVVQPTAGSALQALSVVTIVRVPHSALRQAAARYPAIAEAFWRDCMVDSAVASQWIVNLGCRDARTRIAHLLCEVGVRVGVEPAGPVSFPFTPTQIQIGEMTGITPVHVNRTFKSLRLDGLATLSGGMVKVTDWQALAKAGQFEPRYLQISGKPEQRTRICQLVR